jgi:hypothetical protein
MSWEAAYQSGGLVYALKLCKNAGLVGDVVAKRSKDYGHTPQGATEELAQAIGRWAPGLLRQIAEQK